MDSTDSSDCEIPREVSELAKAATSNLLPDKSSERYEKEYVAFMNWCCVKNVTVIKETVVLAYFVEKYSNNKPSTLWCYYSMLKSVLAIKKNIDISKYPKLIAFLKKKSTGYRAKKSKHF